MTRMLNTPESFADEALEGFVAAHPGYVRRVRGGVARATRSPDRQVAVVVGGGTGHYPAFAGWVGAGLAHGAACGNIFASPSASQICSVVRAADNGGGVLATFGNYTGDVLHFGHAAERLRAEGVDVRILPVTDDIASAAPDEAHKRRGIAGDLAVIKVAGAAAADGCDLDEVERVARRANAATRSLGVALTGCTLPGADHPLFTVAEGRMALGLGIHGEPGVQELPLLSAQDTAELLVQRLVAEAPPAGGGRVAVVLNGLGTVKYDELFVVYRSVSAQLREHGYVTVGAEVGEQCASLDMAGLSLTLMWLDEELERYWTAPADSPAFRRGAVQPGEPVETTEEEASADSLPVGSAGSQELASRLVDALRQARDRLVDNERYLGDIDAVAGDGDHGLGMARGARAAVDSAERALTAGVGARTLLMCAADSWAECAGGSSGALWGAGLNAAAATLDDRSVPDAGHVGRAVRAAVDAVRRVGGAAPGDKTMLDAAEPFAATLQSEAGPVPAAWRRAVAAAREAAEATAPLLAQRGRARVLAERSRGTPDPGAVSFALVVEAVADSLGEPR